MDVIEGLVRILKFPTWILVKIIIYEAVRKLICFFNNRIMII
jgi:hypothetical protein